MSKAFTKEDDAPDDALPDDPAPQLPPGARNYITAAGARRLHEELERLKGEHDARRAAREPDSQLRELARRVRQLSRRLQSVEVAPQVPVADRAVFGATVILRDEHDRVRRYRIVGLDEADPRRGEVSWLSPIAQALLRGQVGDLVTLQTPRGAEELEIIGLADEPGA